MSAQPDFIDVVVANGYVHHAARYRPSNIVRLTPVVAAYVGKTLCRRGANGTRTTLDAEGLPVPFEFKEHHCDVCMIRVSKLRRENA